MNKLFIGFVFISLFLVGCSSSNPMIQNKLISSIPNNLEVDKFKLNIPVEEDLRYPPNVIKVANDFPPSINLYTLDFRSNSNEYAYIVAQMPHSRDLNTNLSAHFHWQTSNNNIGDVVWALEYSCASIGSEFPDFQKAYVISSSVENSNIHLMSNEIIIPANNLGISAICKIKIFRDTNDDRDNYDGSAMLLEFDIHYYLNKLGSDKYE